MFKDDYKNDVNRIKPDGYIKDKVLRKIESNQAPKNKKIIFKAVATVAACAVLVVSVFVYRDMSKPQIMTSYVGNTQTYNDVYKVIRNIKARSAISNFTDIFNGGFAKYTNEIADSDMAMPEGAVEEYAITTDDNATAATGTNSATKEHSETNTQVEGVAESDIVLTDGEYIYSITNGKGHLRIIKAGKEPKLLSKTLIKSDLTYDSLYLVGSMYLYDDYLVIIGNHHATESFTVSLIYDVSNPEEPKEVYQCRQSGTYNTSRLIGNKLYLISDYRINLNGVEKNKPETFVPYVECNDDIDIAPADSICISSVYNSPMYTVICSYDITKGEMVSNKSMFGGTYALYCSTNNIITAGYNDGDETPINRYSIDDGKIELKSSGEIKGTLLNQFSIDEHKGNFRFVATLNEGTESRNGNVVSYSMTTKNALYVLDENLEQIGAITDIAPDERVYSVRFMGDTTYFLTFRQVDPLFSVDLSDPKNPKIIGALKIPGFSNYLFPFGEGKLLGIGQDADERTGKTGGIKLSMFDISNPANVLESNKVIIDSRYSSALYDHKSSLVDYKKNLIGLNTMENHGMGYRIFRLTENGFEQIKHIELGSTSEFIRGIYIGDEFYIITNQKLYVFNMSDFEKIAELTFE